MTRGHHDGDAAVPVHLEANATNLVRGRVLLRYQHRPRYRCRDSMLGGEQPGPVTPCTSTPHSCWCGTSTGTGTAVQSDGGHASRCHRATLARGSCTRCGTGRPDVARYQRARAGTDHSWPNVPYARRTSAQHAVPIQAADQMHGDHSGWRPVHDSDRPEGSGSPHPGKTGRGRSARLQRGATGTA